MYVCSLKIYRYKNMNKKKLIIFSGDWLEFHPYQNSVRSDLYYVKLANLVYDNLYQILEDAQQEEDALFLNENEMKRLCCILTCYFEDVVSETRIWAAFVEAGKKRYGKPLPFYSIGDDYVEDQINLEDIQFLIWHFMIQLNELEIPLSPKMPLFQKMSESAMAIFEDEYETAPVNDKLQDFFNIGESDATNIHALYPKFFWLGTESFLFQHDGIVLQSQINDIVEMGKEENMKDELPDMVDLLCNDFAYNHITEFSGLRATEWLGIMLRENASVSASLSALSRKYSGYFFYLDENETSMNFKHIATETIIQVSKRSLGGFPKDMKTADVILFVGFVKWCEEWCLVGQVRSYDRSDELIDKIKMQDDETRLFEEDSDLPEEEQNIILNDLLAEITDEDGEPLDEDEIAWNVIRSEELCKSFLRKAYEEGRIPGLGFEGKLGGLLMKDNMEFVLDYIK